MTGDSPTASFKPQRVFCPLLVVVCVLLSFLPALGDGFTNWDDQKNFLENYGYRGLAPANLKWMVTSFLLGHWIPLTWLSLGLDYAVWGMNPLGYHLTSLILHAANAVLVYLLIRMLLRLAGQEPTPIAALAGALAYAVHPLRVESVVWITERRDVLCGFFVLLSVLAHLKRVEEERQARSGARWGTLSVVAFGASLLSKALGILLPGVLLLLDLYPLGRWKPGSRRRAILEKLPYLVLSCADAVAMSFAMRNIQAMRPIGSYHLAERAAQAAYGLVFYLLKTVWPAGLIPLYRIEPNFNPAGLKYLLALAAVAGLTAFLILRRHRMPGALVAWLSYVILVFPVLGVAVTGMQIAADRYTYLSLLPASVLAAAALNRLDRSSAPARRLGLVAAAGALAALGLLTFQQSRVWKNSITLWTHQLEHDPGCDLAYNSRGAARQDLGDWSGAIADCTRSIELKSGMPDPYLNRGLARAHLGQLDLALQDFDQVVQLDPRRVDGFHNRGLTRYQLGDADGALADLADALTREGQKAGTYALRGSLRASRGDFRGATEDFEHALRVAPPDWAPRADVERKLLRARQAR